MTKTVSFAGAVTLAFAMGGLAVPGLAQTQQPSPGAAAAPAQQRAPAADEQAAGEQSAEAQSFEITGDPAAGERTFVRCQACHSVEPGRNLVGPSLNNVIGREAGTLEDFNYSPAMQQADVVWTPETLHEYLEAPARYIPGNRMIFPGLKDEEERANVIAFLAQHSQVAEQPEAGAEGETEAAD